MPPKKNAPSQELWINSDLEWFIEALPNLEPIHNSFHLAGNDIFKCCLCSCSPCLYFMEDNAQNCFWKIRFLWKHLIHCQWYLTTFQIKAWWISQTNCLLA
jgi:hypothetical protein